MSQELEQFRASLVETLNKNQEDFEKQLIYVSAGTLGASMFFIEKVVKDISLSKDKWLLIASWIFLGSTIVINAISHFVAMNYNYKSIDEIDKGNYSQKLSLSRNKNLKYINLTTVITLLIGIFFLILFTSINISMSDSKQNNQSGNTTKPTTIVAPDVSEKLARTSTPPPSSPKPVQTSSDVKKP